MGLPKSSVATATKERNRDFSARPQLRNGSAVCQCQMCGDFFSGPAVFDKHLLGVEVTRCRTPKERRKAGMVVNEHGVWLKGGKAQG